jgi:hypothetical protein
MKTVTFILILVLHSGSVLAAAAEDEKEPSESNEISQILDGMSYPELQVVPRASERLRMEAKAEASHWYFEHWTFELSGLATLGVGLTSSSRQKQNLSDSEKDSSRSIAQGATAVGAGWLIGGLVFGSLQPYRAGMKNISRYGGKDDRSALTRERLAEEALERPAKTIRVLKHFSVWTNFAVNAMGFTYLDQQGKITAGVAAVLSFLPYMFEDHTVEVHEKHIEYKKKIYAPLKTGSVHFDPETKTLTPMTNLVWLF